MDIIRSGAALYSDERSQGSPDDRGDRSVDLKDVSESKAPQKPEVPSPPPLPSPDGGGTQAYCSQHIDVFSSELVGARDLADTPSSAGAPAQGTAKPASQSAEAHPPKDAATLGADDRNELGALSESIDGPFGVGNNAEDGPPSVTGGGRADGAGPGVGAGGASPVGPGRGARRLPAGVLSVTDAPPNGVEAPALGPGHLALAMDLALSSLMVRHPVPDADCSQFMMAEDRLDLAFLDEPKRKLQDPIAHRDPRIAAERQRVRREREQPRNELWRARRKRDHALQTRGQSLVSSATTSLKSLSTASGHVLLESRVDYSLVFARGMLWLYGGRAPGAAGGQRAGGLLVGLYRLDPGRSDGWAKLPDTAGMPGPLAGHSAVVMDDMMLVFGGVKPGPAVSDSLFGYNLTTGQWNALQRSGAVGPGRTGHAAARWGSALFVYGGTTSATDPEDTSAYLSDLIRYTLNTGEWDVPPLYKAQDPGVSRPCPVLGARAVVMDDVFMLVGGRVRPSAGPGLGLWQLAADITRQSNVPLLEDYGTAPSYHWQEVVPGGRRGPDLSEHQPVLSVSSRLALVLTSLAKTSTQQAPTQLCHLDTAFIFDQVHSTWSSCRLLPSGNGSGPDVDRVYGLTRGVSLVSVPPSAPLALEHRQVHLNYYLVVGVAVPKAAVDAEKDLAVLAGPGLDILLERAPAGVHVYRGTVSVSLSPRRVRVDTLSSREGAPGLFCATQSELGDSLAGSESAANPGHPRSGAAEEGGGDRGAFRDPEQERLQSLQVPYWEPALYRRHPELTEFVTRLRALSHSPSFARRYNYARTDARLAVPSLDALQLVYAYLDQLQLVRTLAAIQEETGIPYLRSEQAGPYYLRDYLRPYREAAAKTLEPGTDLGGDDSESRRDRVSAYRRKLLLHSGRKLLATQAAALHRRRVQTEKDRAKLGAEMDHSSMLPADPKPAPGVVGEGAAGERGASASASASASAGLPGSSPPPSTVPMSLTLDAGPGFGDGGGRRSSAIPGVTPHGPLPELSQGLGDPEDQQIPPGDPIEPGQRLVCLLQLGISSLKKVLHPGSDDDEGEHNDPDPLVPFTDELVMPSEWLGHGIMSVPIWEEGPPSLDTTLVLAPGATMAAALEDLSNSGHFLTSIPERLDPDRVVGLSLNQFIRTLATWSIAQKPVTAVLVPILPGLLVPGQFLNRLAQLIRVPAAVRQNPALAHHSAPFRRIRDRAIGVLTLWVTSLRRYGPITEQLHRLLVEFVTTTQHREGEPLTGKLRTLRAIADAARAQSALVPGDSAWLVKLEGFVEAAPEVHASRVLFSPKFRVLHDTDEEELSRQLTLDIYLLARCLAPSTLMNRAWLVGKDPDVTPRVERGAPPQETPILDAILDRQHRLTQAFQRYLVAEQDLRARTHRFERMIRLGQFLFSMRNYEDFYSVVLTFEHPAIARLRATRTALERRSQHSLQAWHTRVEGCEEPALGCDWPGNEGPYHAEISTTEKPFIPSFRHALSRAAKIDADSPSNMLPGTLLFNIPKLLELAHYINTTFKGLTSHPNFLPVYQILHALGTLSAEPDDRVTDERLKDMSRRCES